MCRQAHHRAIAEHVVLAIDQAQFMPQIEIARVEAVPGGGVGPHASIPFAPLHQHRRVWDQRVAADMVEMEMRVDDEIDLRRVAADRLKPGIDFLARCKPIRNAQQAACRGGRRDRAGNRDAARYRTAPCPSGARSETLGPAQLCRPQPPSISRANSPVTVPQVKA